MGLLVFLLLSMVSMVPAQVLIGSFPIGTLLMPQELAGIAMSRAVDEVGSPQLVLAGTGAIGGALFYNLTGGPGGPGTSIIYADAPTKGTSSALAWNFISGTVLCGKEILGEYFINGTEKRKLHVGALGREFRVAFDASGGPEGTAWVSDRIADRIFSIDVATGTAFGADITTGVHNPNAILLVGNVLVVCQDFSLQYFDKTTRAPLFSDASIKDTDGLAYHQASDRLFVSRFKGASGLTVINFTTRQHLFNISVPSPRHLVIIQDKLFVNSHTAAKMVLVYQLNSSSTPSPTPGTTRQLIAPTNGATVVINGSVVQLGGVDLSQGQAVVNGDLTVSIGTQQMLVSPLFPVIVNGSLEIQSGSLLVMLTSQDVSKLHSGPTTVSVISAESVAGLFDAVNITGAQLQPCEALGLTQIPTPLFSVSISLDRSKCNPGALSAGAIVGIAVGAIVVALAAMMLIFAINRKQKIKFDREENAKIRARDMREIVRSHSANKQ